MTTFQSFVYAVVHGFAEFLPISASAHQTLVAYLIGWDVPSGALAAALSLGAFLSLLLYFRHDWASMTSSFLQIILFRKRPMTLDERMPFFIFMATLPAGAAWHYLRDPMASLPLTPMHLAIGLAVLGLPLWFVDSFSRKTKRMYDWSWLDSLLVGLTQVLMLVPGAGRAYGAWLGALGRNYSREAAAKFGFFTAMPILAAGAALRLRDVHFGAPAPASDLSWLSFGVAVVVTTLAGLLAIGGFLKHIQRKGVGHYAVYRIIVAIAIGVATWVRTRG